MLREFVRIFQAPEAELGVFPESVAGLDVIELGCGTAYISAWLARRGAHPVGIDNSPAQLATARRMQEQFGIAFPLHLGNAEETGFPDASFDLAISEYGAALFTADGFFALPAYPLETVFDPTGAGDSFAGGFLGYLASQDSEDDAMLVLRALRRGGYEVHSTRVDTADAMRMALLDPTGPTGTRR